MTCEPLAAPPLTRWDDPTATTVQLHRALPLLALTNWQLTALHPGSAQSVLPLGPMSSNHQGTINGAMMLLAAECTAATALVQALGPVPVLGIHVARDAAGVVIWAVDLAMKYMRPAMGDLTVTATVSPSAIATARRAYTMHKRAKIAVAVSCSTADGRCASGLCVLVLDNRHAAAAAAPATTGAVQTAQLIAGIRARGGSKLGINDPFAAQMAGPDGLVLAARLEQAQPVLPEMIAARTRHLDHVLLTALAEQVSQIVFVGVGLDCRIFRLPIDPAAARVFELDLSETLALRSTMLARFPYLPARQRFSLAVDVLRDDVGATLLAHDAFDPARPTLVIVEGLSYYLHEHTNRQLLRSLAPLLIHPQSQLWMDGIARSVVDGSAPYEAAQALARVMREIGAPLQFGWNDPQQFLRSAGYRLDAAVRSDMYRAEHHGLFDLYHFLLVSPEYATTC